MKARFKYFFIVILIIAIGLLSRKLPIPFFIGDVLYAMMIYFILRSLFITRKLTSIFCIAIFLCFLIEFSQLIREPWLHDLRNSWIGRHVLGSGFLLTDLLAYVGGATVAFLIDESVWSRLKN